MRQRDPAPPSVQAARRRGDRVIRVNDRLYKIISRGGSTKVEEVKTTARMNLWARLMAFLFGLSGCGGAAFVYGIDPAPDAGAESSVVEASAGPEGSVPDAGPDVLFGHPMPEASVPDTGVDAPVLIDAGPDATAPEAGSTCTPIAPTTHLCGVNGTIVTSPSQWCWITGFGSSMPQGNIESTPTRCRCAETYDCACVMAVFGQPSCGGVNDPTPARCSDGTGSPVVQCP